MIPEYPIFLIFVIASLFSIPLGLCIKVYICDKNNEISSLHIKEEGYYNEFR